MNKIVFDSSAVLAFLKNEKGSDLVAQNLKHSIISAVNFCEIVTVTNREIFVNDEEKSQGLKLLKESFINIEDYDINQAIISASFDKITKKFGLGIGDRSCLALAKFKKLPVLTADKIWKKLDIGVDIKFIR